MYRIAANYLIFLRVEPDPALLFIAVQPDVQIVIVCRCIAKPEETGTDSTCQLRFDTILRKPDAVTGRRSLLEAVIEFSHRAGLNGVDPSGRKRHDGRASVVLRAAPAHPVRTSEAGKERIIVIIGHDALSFGVSCFRGPLGHSKRATHRRESLPFELRSCFTVTHGAFGRCRSRPDQRVHIPEIRLRENGKREQKNEA